MTCLLEAPDHQNLVLFERTANVLGEVQAPGVTAKDSC